jgi:hypothetical protein
MGDSLLPSRPVLRITGIVWTIEIHQVVFFVECGRDLSSFAHAKCCRSWRFLFYQASSACAVATWCRQSPGGLIGCRILHFETSDGCTSGLIECEIEIEESRWSSVEEASVWRERSMGYVWW